MSDEVYRERAQLVAYLAAQHPSVMHPAEDVDEPGWGIVYVATPAGQMAWHIAPADMGMFGHVPWNPAGATNPWDGHTTPEKYDRLAKLTGMGAGPPSPSVVAHPGDTLVIGIDRMLSMDEVVRMDAAFRERMPDVKVVVVDGATSFAVCRPEPERVEPLTSIVDAPVECSLCGTTGPAGGMTMDDDERWVCDDTGRCAERAARGAGT